MSKVRIGMNFTALTVIEKMISNASSTRTQEENPTINQGRNVEKEFLERFQPIVDSKLRDWDLVQLMGSVGELMFKACIKYELAFKRTLPSNTFLHTLLFGCLNMNGILRITFMKLRSL